MAKDLSGAAIIFDLDGTLVDTAGDLAASMNYTLELAGLAPLPPADVRHLVGFGAKAMLRHGYDVTRSGEAVHDDELDRALVIFLEHYHANIAVTSRPFEGAVDIIKALRVRGAGVAICTNKREQPSHWLIDELGLQDLFDTIVGSDTAVAPKPDAAPVLLCMERLGADRAVFIGDSDTDIKAAKAAGIPCLVAKFGYGPLALASNNVVRFDSYESAARLIEAALEV